MRLQLGQDSTWYDFDGTRLLVKEARELEELTGMGLQDFSDGIKRGKVDALVFMLYLAKKRSGEPVRFRDFDEVDIASLRIEDDEQDAAGEPPDGSVGEPEGARVVAVNGRKPAARTARPTARKGGKKAATG